MRRLAGLTMAVAMALALVAPVAADTTGGGPGAAYSDGMTISITSTKVVAKVLVEVTFDLTCAPAPDGATWEDNYFVAYVKQASGRSVATGSVDWYTTNIGAMCDGAVHRITASVTADYGSVPFKKGTAVVGVTGTASYYTETCDEWCDSTGGSRRASTGWVVTKLGR
jgi:hypothetical protein